MSSQTTGPLPTRLRWPTLAILLATAAALGVAFVLAPRTLAANRLSADLADRRNLVEAVHESFDGYWRSGGREFSASLKEVVGYWFRYHVAKASIAALLMAVFVVLAVLFYRALLSGGGKRATRSAALASAGGAFTMLALACLVTVMANIQGAVAPFGSLLPMVTDGAADPELAVTLDQVRQGLADTGAGHQTPPALQVMISDFSRFHSALAICAVVAALIFVGLSVLFWRRFAVTQPADRRTRRAFGSFGFFAALLALVFGIGAVANLTTAAHPAPALLAFFTGGW